MNIYKLDSTVTFQTQRTRSQRDHYCRYVGKYINKQRFKSAYMCFFFCISIRIFTIRVNIFSV